MREMKISICSQVKNRLFQLEQTFEENSRIIRDSSNVEWVIVDINSTDGLESFMKGKVTDKIFYYKLLEYMPYHIPVSKNFAARLSSGDYVFNLDIDNFIGDAIEKIREMRYANIACGTKREGVFGRIGCLKNIFKCAGGYDESFLPASRHEQDFISRCKILGFSFKDSCPSIAPIQNDKEETVKNMDMSVSWETMNHFNQEKQRINLERRTINPNERHGSGTFMKNFSETVRLGAGFDKITEEDTTSISNLGHLEPHGSRSSLPSWMSSCQCMNKIFVIGFNKCATKSLHQLFEKANLKSSHQEDYVELNKYDAFFNKNVSDGLEIYYELCGQNSLFVLNTRSIGNWIKSRFRHAAHTNFEESWCWPPTSQLVRSWVALREGHYARVVDFFEDKPSQLIVLDMEKDDWADKILKRLQIRKRGVNFHQNKDLEIDKNNMDLIDQVVESSLLEMDYPLHEVFLNHKNIDDFQYEHNFRTSE